MLLTVASNLGSLTSSSSTAAVTVTVPTPEATSTGASGGSGLSTGATAGIAVGATLVGVGLIAGLVWFLIKRKRKSRNCEKPTTGAPELASMNSRREGAQRDNRGSRYSELAVKSPSPTPTPEMQQFRYSGQPSPGFGGPPQYSQHYDGQVVEMVSGIVDLRSLKTDIFGSLTIPVLRATPRPS